MSSPMAAITVRQAGQADWPLCLAFERLDEYGRVTGIDEQVVKAHIAMEAVFLAEDERGQAVGYASLNFLYASRMPLLSWWYVDEACRGKGVGSLLLAEVERRLAKAGFESYMISACRDKEIARHKAAGLPMVGSVQLSPKELEYFFSKRITLR